MLVANQNKNGLMFSLVAFLYDSASHLFVAITSTFGFVEILFFRYVLV